jgi:hydroxymethylpyrimidine pyrophosphatase-like HAD family hydrolase
VINRPDNKKTINPHILDELIKKLKIGEPVVLITGRASKWIMDRIVKPLEDKIQGPNLLNLFFLSAEFGASYSSFEQGSVKHFLNKNMALPDNVIKKAREIAEGFPDTMMVDPYKETMFTVEMRDESALKDFKRDQVEIDKELEHLIDSSGLRQSIEVHTDRIATNLRNKDLNKSYATREVLEWINKKGLHPECFIVFGDSQGDREISDEIHNQGMKVKLIFVGGKNNLDTTGLSYDLVYADEEFDRGTLSFLTKTN